MKIITLLTFLLFATFIKAQAIYSKAFGDNKNEAIIFLHGGPGYNCASFEVTTAQKLANKGFYVIVYDRRGEGRSKDATAAYTFNQTFNDLNDIYTEYNLSKAVLLGHSFGGIVATLFAEKYPNKVKAIGYIGAPVSLQSSFKNIIYRVRKIYEAKQDSITLKYVALLEKMDTTSLSYSSYCFNYAMQNNFYSAKNKTEEAKEIYATFKTDTSLKKLASSMSVEPTTGFWKNEKYTTIDLTRNIKALANSKIKLFGLYGKDDGLYSINQIEQLEILIGKQNVYYLSDCSHSVFIDQQAFFINKIETILKQ